MAKAELYQIEQTTLFKDFCNNTSVFLQQHFSISTTSFRIFATCFICTEAQRNSFDPKKRYVTNTGPELVQSEYRLCAHISLQTNRHFSVPSREFQLVQTEY